jgi:hypothetical protein
MNMYSDLEFLIPKGIRSADEVPKGFIYAGNMSGGLDMVDYLDGLLPTKLRGTGLIRPYNMGLSQLGNGAFQGRNCMDSSLH